jgi:uncharacterized protein
VEFETLLLLAIASLFAGFVDSIVGGGGVITLPSLLAAGVPPHLALGTNKVAGTGASAMATWQYTRAGLVMPRLVALTFPLAVGGGILGAVVVLRLPESFVVALIVVLLVAMTAYILLRPRFGTQDRFSGLRPATLAATAALALAVGFYDGMLGPGTGNLLLFGLVAIHGFAFLPAAAHGRVLNFGSNIGALGYFSAVSNIDWTIGLVMAIGTVTGAFIGSRFGIRHGAKWIRPLFVFVALVLLVRLVFW